MRAENALEAIRPPGAGLRHAKAFFLALLLAFACLAAATARAADSRPFPRLAFDPARYAPYLASDLEVTGMDDDWYMNQRSCWAPPPAFVAPAEHEEQVRFLVRPDDRPADFFTGRPVGAAPTPEWMPVGLEDSGVAEFFSTMGLAASIEVRILEF